MDANQCVPHEVPHRALNGAPWTYSKDFFLGLSGFLGLVGLPALPFITVPILLGEPVPEIAAH